MSFLFCDKTLQMSFYEKTKEIAREYIWTLFHIYRPTRNRKMKYAAALSMIGGLAAYLLISDIPKPHVPGQPHFTICALKLLTDVPCVGCGTTRGLKYLFHGMPYEAVMMNPLSILTALYMAVSTVWIICDLITGKSSYLNLYSYRPGKVMWAIIIILGLANWAWNIQKGL